MRNGIIIVEGPHDLAFFVRILRKRFRFEERRLLHELPELGRDLLPTAFPTNEEGDIHKRAEVPSILVSADWTLAIQAANGDSRIVGSLKRAWTRMRLQSHEVAAVGFVLDSDSVTNPNARLEGLRRELQAEGLPTAEAPGVVLPGPPRVAALVLPNNQSPGTLEKLLLACSATRYPELHSLAHSHVEGAIAAMARLTSDERREFNAPAGRDKAQVASIANLLKPGKAVQVSIQDNAWLTAETMALPALQPAVSFLRDLLELEAT